ncbi:hypothetical protein M3J09_007591 [Ascochyta lentis]
MQIHRPFCTGYLSLKSLTFPPTKQELELQKFSISSCYLPLSIRPRTAYLIAVNVNSLCVTQRTIQI